MTDNTPRTIWIINQYASTPKTGIGGRHYSLARALAKQGHKVYLVAASFSHILRKPHESSRNFDVEFVEGFHFVWIKMPGYRDAHDPRRVLGWFVFAFKLLSLNRVIDEKPDVILVSSPSLIAYLGARRLAGKNDARLAFEVRDIWPLSLIELGGYSPRHPFMIFLQWIEDKAYRDADYVISNLPNAWRHMIERGMDKRKFTWIPNGIDIAELEHHSPLGTDIYAQVPRGKFVVGYAGTLGLANMLDTLLDAANLLRHDDSIAFLLVGGGKNRQQLVERCKRQGLANVYFIDPVEKRQVCGILQCFDICYIGLARSPIFKFGVSPNKLFEYLFSGKPIVYAVDSGDYSPIRDAGAGIEVPAGDARAVAKAILDLKKLSPAQLTRLAGESREYLLENHEYSKLASKLAAVIFPREYTETAGRKT